VSQLHAYFTSEQLKVSIDTPYQGCFLPEKFIGNSKVITLMIEINRKLYIDEISDNEFIKVWQTPSKSDNFNNITRIISRAITDAVDILAGSSLLSYRLQITKDEKYPCENNNRSSCF
jgi:hypothetical protein